MKAKVAFLLCLFSTTVLAGPSRPINSSTFVVQTPCGPAHDPYAQQGQWFLNLGTGTTNVNVREYHDDDNSLSIAGVVQNITFQDPANPFSNILAFDILATVSNTLPSTYQAGSASNSHSEVQNSTAVTEGGSIMDDVRITAEFAIPNQGVIPSGTPPYWPDPFSGGQYHIVALNADEHAWYCWDPNQTNPQYQPAGAYQVPAWNLTPSTIPPGGTATVLMQFMVTGSGIPYGMSDYRHGVLRYSQDAGKDVLYNRYPSLKISHWLDTIVIDNGTTLTTPPFPYWEGDEIEYIHASDASVFYNDSEEEEYPHKMHWPQLPDPNGWDVRACRTPPTDIEPEIRKVLADDFLCTSNGYINHITFWGSWFSNMFMDVSQHPYQGITNIHLSIHADIPAGEVAPWSMPGSLLWEKDIDPAIPPFGWIVLPPEEEEPSWQGWYDPNTGLWQLNNHDRYFRYEIYIPNEEAFLQVSNTIYWLDISVATTNGLWGWKTSRSPHFNDDAVWADLPVTNLAQWQELRDPLTEESLDLAFIIDEHEPEIDWGDAPDQPYPTLNASAGANHTIVPGMHLGAGVDGEPDGQPNGNAKGDDMNINGLGGIAFPPGDEDGISFTQLVPGLPAIITVTASQAGMLDAWIDYNADGLWSAGEQLTGASIPLNAGNNLINITVPIGTTPVLSTFARFRYSSVGGLAPTGAAPDGEVEDYEVSIDDPMDWGDAPDPTYPTLSASGGAYHLISGPFMGNTVDPDLDGQPTPQADGDDLDLQGDDEDGVTFTPPYLIPGTVAQVDVVMNGAVGAALDAWIDFNADGDWNDPGEQIFNTFALGIGNNSLFFTVPTNTVALTNTYARFRISSAGGLTPSGFAQDGEVEDYRLNVSEEQPIDWTDAPVSYQTLAVNNGAHHVAVGVYLGGQRDAETDGIPTPGADGDDLSNLPDEDGVTFTSPVQPGGIATVRVVASGAGVLDAWMDFNNNGGWADPGERIFAGIPLSAGTNNLSFGVPLVTTNNSPGSTYARFRYSFSGVTSYAGLALDGEVEDYKLPIRETEYLGVDRGDAPDPPYPTSTNSAGMGAHHTIIPGYILGASIDSESEGQFSANAQGDDIANIDDEDGVVFTSKITAGVTSSVNVVCGVLPAYLDAWIDFDNDGTWGAGEQIFTSQSVSPGVNSLSFTPPNPPPYLGSTFARFRLSSSGGLGVTGPAPDGEVEDYRIDLWQPQPSTNIVITNFYFTATQTVANVEWNAETNITYQVQGSTNLTTNVWADVGAQVIGPNNWQTNSTAHTQQFYRVTAPWTE